MYRIYFDRSVNVTVVYHSYSGWSLWHLEEWITDYNLENSIGSCFFFIVRNCSFFMGIIFCSSVAIVWTFSNRGVYNFITKEPNIPVNLVPFFKWCLVPILSLLKVWSNEWAKKYFSRKVQKSQSYLFQTGENFAAHKTLVWSTCVWRTATATNFLEKSNIWAR